MTITNRPPCPSCKSLNIRSKGERWRCKNCGREFLKNIKRKYREKIDWNNRPKCPYCEGKVYSSGDNWRCKDCNRSSTKIFKITNMENSHPLFKHVLASLIRKCMFCGKEYNNRFRFICGDVIMHHINHDRKDCRLENLTIIGSGCHGEIHSKEIYNLKSIKDLLNIL